MEVFDKNYNQFSVYENMKSPSTSVWGKISRLLSPNTLILVSLNEMHPKNLRKLIPDKEKHQNIIKEKKNCRNKGIQCLISHQAANS